MSKMWRPPRRCELSCVCAGRSDIRRWYPGTMSAAVSCSESRFARRLTEGLHRRDHLAKARPESTDGLARWLLFWRGDFKHAAVRLPDRGVRAVLLRWRAGGGGRTEDFQSAVLGITANSTPGSFRHGLLRRGAQGQQDSVRGIRIPEANHGSTTIRRRVTTRRPRSSPGKELWIGSISTYERRLAKGSGVG